MQVWSRLCARVLFGLVLVTSRLGNSHAEAQSQSPSQNAKADDDEEADEQKQDQSASDASNSILIPKVLKGRGYRLRTPKSLAPLNTDRVELSDEWSVVGELLDKDGRVVDRGPVLVGYSLSLRPNYWSLSLTFASTRPLNPTAWNKALLPIRFPEFALELQYRASRFWNVWAVWSSHIFQKTYDESLTLDYESAFLLVGAAREFAPWGNLRQALLRRLHIVGMAGVGVETNEYRLSDRYTQIHDESAGPVLALGAEIRMPVLHDFWIFARDLARVAKVEVEELGVKEFILFNSTSWGVSYAF